MGVLGTKSRTPARRASTSKLLVLEAGHQDGRHVVARVFDLPEEVQAALPRRKLLVEHDQLDSAGGDQLERRRSAVAAVTTE